MKNLPIIDLSSLEDPETLDALDLACRDWGFFQIVNHSIDETVCARMLDEARLFFNQTRIEKLKIARSKDNPWGFFDQEYTKNTLDWKELFDYGPQHEGVYLPQWPDGFPEFRASVTNYYQQCEQLAFRLLAAISRNLCLPADFLDHHFQPEHTSFVRVNYYPPCPNPESPSDVSTPVAGHMGVNHHTDAGAVTILLQDQNAGLEVQHNGSWHLVQPLEGALVVNIGDIVQVWSNDRYKAALHRARVNSEEGRFSVPFFFNPAYTANYEPWSTTESDPAKARYETINWGEFRAQRAAGDFSDSGLEIQIDQFRKESTT
jgi:isopenicillin N synthase-like dioxygenase